MPCKVAVFTLWKDEFDHFVNDQKYLVNDQKSFVNDQKYFVNDKKQKQKKETIVQNRSLVKWRNEFVDFLNKKNVTLEKYFLYIRIFIKVYNKIDLPKNSLGRFLL